MPPIESFIDAESFYARARDHALDTPQLTAGARLNFGRKTRGDEGYAREELLAESGSAFLCNDLELTPEVCEDHAACIASWLTALKNDKRAILQAASHAQRAVDFLHGLQQPKAEAA